MAVCKLSIALISTLAVLIFSFQTIRAQEKRPKIGLVLSGGGAKGIAHIGVLKAMEEAGLTPDYITGTSMGSIVGGLYAAGYTADELKDIVETADWSNLLTNKIRFDKITYEEKEYYGRYHASFDLDSFNLVLPKGIIEGQMLMQLFSKLTRHVHGINDFNDLPIPFACIGTNITTGEAVVLNKGSLAQSMRASMAIPSIFTPVKLDGKLLVDGGLVHNMPVKEVIEMGADIVIGVFVSSDLSPESELTSPVAILSQAAFITSAFDQRKELEKCDILIQPGLSDFSTGSFGSAREILASGDGAGKAYSSVFIKLADSLRQFGPLKKVIRPKPENEYIFQDIQVVGASNIDKSYIMGRMQIEPGQRVNIEYIEKKLDLMFGTLYFEKIWFEILGAQDNRILKIYVKERPKGQVKFAFHYDTENVGGVVFNATMRNFLLKRSRLLFEADLANYPRLTLDYFKYLTRSQKLALQVTGRYVNNELPVYDSTGYLDYIFTTNYYSLGARLQTTIFQNSVMGIEAMIQEVNLTPKFTAAEVLISKIKYYNNSYSLYYRHDGTNERYFPTNGLKAEVSLSMSNNMNGKVEIADSVSYSLNESKELFQTTNITSLNFSFFPIVPLNSRLSLLFKTRLRFSELKKSTLNISEYDFVGGFLPGWINSNEFYGVNRNEFVLANYFHLRLSLQYRLKKNIFIQGHVHTLSSRYPMVWVYPEGDFSRLGDRNTRVGYGGLIGINSPIGPIAFSFAKDHNRNDWSVTLIIGYVY